MRTTPILVPSIADQPMDETACHKLMTSLFGEKAEAMGTLLVYSAETNCIKKQAEQRLEFEFDVFMEAAHRRADAICELNSATHHNIDLTPQRALRSRTIPTDINRMLRVDRRWMAFGLAAAVVLAIVIAPGSLKLFNTPPFPNEPARVSAGPEQQAMVPLEEPVSRPKDSMRRDSVEPSEPSVAVNDQQLSELNRKLIEARADAAEKKARVDYVEEVAAGKKSLESFPNSLQSSSSVTGVLRTKLADASQRSADLSARYNSRHPAVVNVEAEKRDIERNIAAETQRLAQTVRSEYALAKARLDAVEQAMREATGQGELASSSRPSVALNDRQVSELNRKLIAARADAAEKKTRLDFLADVAGGKKTLDSLPDSLQLTSDVMGPLRAKLADASQRAADLLARYNSRHPAVVSVEAEKRDIERSIAAETQRMAQTAMSEYALAKARLDAMEEAMREATGQGDLASSSGPSVALNDQQLSELNTKLIAARADAAEKKTRVDFLADVVEGKKTLDSFQSTSSVMGTLRAKLADASQRSTDLLARYNSRHPAVVNAEAEKRDIERGIAAETQRMAQTARSEYALAKARLEAIEQALREATGQGDISRP